MKNINIRKPKLFINWHRSTINIIYIGSLVKLSQGIPTSAASEVVGDFLVEAVGVGLLLGEVDLVLVKHLVYGPVCLP